MASYENTGRSLCGASWLLAGQPEATGHSRASQPASQQPSQPGSRQWRPGEMVLSCLVMGELLDAEVDRLEAAGFAAAASGCSAERNQLQGRTTS